MKPLNQSVKEKATRLFILVYVLSLVMTLLLAYLWFSSPMSIVKDNLKKNQEFLEQHDSLVSKTSDINTIVRSLVDLDKRTMVSQNIDDENSIKNNIDNIRIRNNDLSMDTAKINNSSLQMNLKNFLEANNAIIYFSGSEQSLRDKYLNLKSNVDKSDNGSTIAALTQCQNQNLALTQQLAEAKNRAVIPVPVGGGAGESTKLRQDNENLKKENEDLKAAKEKAMSDLANAKNTSTPVPSSLPGCSPTEKADIMFKAADEIYIKAMGEKKRDIQLGYLYSAFDIIKNPLTQNYVDKDRLSKRTKEIYDHIHPLDNN